MRDYETAEALFDQLAAFALGFNAKETRDGA